MTMKQIEINKEEFKKLREEAGFKSDAELAEFLGYNSKVIMSWHRKNQYPVYIFRIFNSLKEVHKLARSLVYFEEVKDLALTKEERIAIVKLKKYRIENNKLEAKILTLKNKIKLKK